MLTLCVWRMVYATHSLVHYILFHSSFAPSRNTKCPMLFERYAKTIASYTTNTHPCDVVRNGKGRKIIYGEHCSYSCVRVYSTRETRKKWLYAKSISFLYIFVPFFFVFCFFFVVVTQQHMNKACKIANGSRLLLLLLLL